MGRKPRVLLLNPPGTKNYLRDYYCSSVSKSGYYWHPFDLAYQTGWLDPHFELNVIDAIVTHKSPEETQRDILAYKPDILIFVISSPSYEEDTTFLTELKKQLPKTKFVGCGDIYREIREKAFALHPFLDATYQDFSTPDLLNYLKGPRGKALENVIYKTKEGKIVAGAEKHGYGAFGMPVPRWDLFPLHQYRFPFSRRGACATMLTDFGCPFTCTFCPMSTVGFKLRDIPTVLKEIKLLVKQGIHEFHFRDQTFGVNKPRTYQLLDKIIQDQLDLSWTVFTRVDVVNDELLIKMKQAGCHTLMFGIESANEEMLIAYKKNTRIQQMTDAIQLAKKHSFRVVGTFVLGLPGESRESVENTIKFSTRIGLNYASFNIATPRFGSTFRKDMLAKGIVDADKYKVSSMAKPVWKEKGTELTNEEIYALQRKANRAFYLRPSWIIRTFLSVKTAYELKEHLREGAQVLTQLTH
ncbi:MAG TPA: radical SAM protein [Candidatus Nanoarchaeia archaeon]|nr:radical SAM protein [Candidatus Nanoarchaeia archaeon]